MSDSSPVTAICPGSYDPVTNGHLDIITRAAGIFERVVVGVVRDPQHKKAMFSVEERVQFLRDALADYDNIEVEVFAELVVEFARAWGAKTMVKGLRAISDFEWEFQMHHLNRNLGARGRDHVPDVEPAVQLPLVERGEGGRIVRRRRSRSRAGASRQAVSRDVPAAERWRARLAARVDSGDNMDVLVLIDKLDDLVHNAKAVPLTDQVRIDREEIYDILDQMRATIPEEIKQARWIVKERQEMLAEAKRESDRILGEAREQAVREASQTEIVKLAERQAQEIVEDARRQARETRLEMEDWADSILSTLEVNLDKFLGAVRRGRERLHERSQESVVAGITDEQQAV